MAQKTLRVLVFEAARTPAWHEASGSNYRMCGVPPCGVLLKSARDPPESSMERRASSPVQRSVLNRPGDESGCLAVFQFTFALLRTYPRATAGHRAEHAKSARCRRRCD